MRLNFIKILMDIGQVPFYNYKNLKLTNLLKSLINNAIFKNDQ